MSYLNVSDIERQARLLRAQELQRIEGIISARLVVYARLLVSSAASGLQTVSKTLRPLFSWNPGDARSGSRASGPTLFARASQMLRALFSWNPQAHRS